MKQTQNFQLNQWEMSDRIQMEDFNEDNQKIDGALHEIRQQLTESHSQLRTEVSKLGNCQILYQTYTGTGTGANSFTFPHKPLFIAIFADDAYFFAMQGAPYATCRNGGSDGGVSRITWTANSVSWQNNSAQYQCNVKGIVYQMVVWMDAAA